MTKTARWNDGRSGESGRFAGNLVLDHLDPTGQRIRNLKGTVFADSQNCWIGRVVADDSYLSTGVAHWANISADQQRELMVDAIESRRKLFYLFITAHANTKTIRYWLVPAEVLGRELARRNKNGKGDVLGLHISIRDSRYILGDEDVTGCTSEFQVAPSDATKLDFAVEADRSRKKQPAQRTVSIPERGTDTYRRFDVPLSDGRLATLHAPVPMNKTDVNRIKNYIDVIADLLV